MKRRDFLGTSGLVLATATSGCTGAEIAITCRLEDRYDTLELKTIEDGGTNGVVLEFDNLPSKAQHSVEAAAEDGTYRQCHNSGGTPSRVMALYNAIEDRWEEMAEDETDLEDRTYLRYDGDDYGAKIVLSDVTALDSIPEGRSTSH